jgi:membrane-associated protease RseP (regulator of RpoE activity)
MRSLKSTWLLAVALAAVAALPVTAAAQGWLGVTTQSTDEDLRRGLDLTRDGLLVNRVFEGSPAERAGLRKGDVILRYDGRSVADPGELRSYVRDSRVGETVPVEIWRNGSRRTLDVEVGEVPASEPDSFETPVPPAPRAPRAPAPPAAPRAPRTPEPDRSDEPNRDTIRRMIIDGRELSEDEIRERLEQRGLKELKDLKGLEGLADMMWMHGDGPGSFMMVGRGRLGVRVEKLTSDLAQALGVDGDRGVLVLQVMEDTPAQKAGIRAGDVILRVGNRDVSDSEELTRELRQREGRTDIVVLRKGSRRTIEVDLPERSAAMRWRDGSGTRPFSMRFPEPGRTPRVYRWQGQDGGSTDALREELRQLRRELEELRREMNRK